MRQIKSIDLMRMRNDEDFGFLQQGRRMPGEAER